MKENLIFKNFEEQGMKISRKRKSICERKSTEELNFPNVNKSRGND